MREISVEDWNRKATFEFFKDFEDPFFNLTAPVDVTALYDFCGRNRMSFAIMCVYCSLKAANSIPELRTRYLGHRIVEFDVIHATQTILNDDDSFSFCYFEYFEDPIAFEKAGRAAVAKYRDLKTFDVETERVDLIYFSVIPWVSFTSFKHAGRADNRQSVPRMVFGKIYADGDKRLMPHSVEVHHAFADGLHVGRYFEAFQRAADEFRDL